MALAEGVDKFTYGPIQFIAGDADIRSKDVLCLANAAIIPPLTPMKRDVNNKAIPATAVGDKIIGITVPRGISAGALVGKPISGTDSFEPMYTHGDFFASMINFLAITAITTATVTDAENVKRDAVFDSTGINIKFVAPGLV
jgi:hypothetical protein